ncbi:MAG: ABC transporter permease [Pirellulales bacterium]
MNFWLTLRVAYRALAKNKMRAGLTILGVVIGIASVTTLVSLGQSAGGLVLEQFQSLGTNLLVVFPRAERSGGAQQGTSSGLSLTAEDSRAIGRDCPSVLASSCVVGARGQLIYGNANWSPQEMFGADTEYLTVRNWPIAYGGFFTEQDVAGAAKVCVIGRRVVQELFQTTNPIGQTIRINKIPFEVVGVLQTKGANLVGQDQDDILIMPYSTARKRLQGSTFQNVDALMVSARSPQSMTEAEFEIESLLRDRHGIGPDGDDDFEVGNSTEIANILGIITGTMTALLASIAGISLLVGGVGIMNIMLVSVTERTREIGIRMAVGATGRDILRQFLIESVVLSCIGGVIGLALGVAASIGATVLINSITSGSKWPIVVSLPAAVIAIGFAAFVGMFFGYYPARRASKLDPIDALRYE